MRVNPLSGGASLLTADMLLRNENIAPQSSPHHPALRRSPHRIRPHHAHLLTDSVAAGKAVHTAAQLLHVVHVRQPVLPCLRLNSVGRL